MTAVFVVIILIICATVLMAMYMYYCSENRIGMFKNPNYGKRIKELEKQMEELKKE